MRRGDGDAAHQRTVLDLRQRAGQVVEQEIDLPARDRRQGGRSALERHVQQADSGHGLEIGAGQVHRRAHARRRVGQFVVLALAGRLDHVGQCAVGRPGADGQHVGRGRHQRDRHQVPARVVRHVGVEELVDALRTDGAQAQRVAVGLAARDVRHADVAAGARPVFHQHGLLQVRLHRMGDGAPEDVRRAAGRIRHHDRHGMLGVARGACLRRQRRHARGNKGADCRPARAPLPRCSLHACLHLYPSPAFSKVRKYVLYSSKHKRPGQTTGSTRMPASAQRPSR
ncbi:Uncharacterised protein [Bordetella pertussis]|nr:Uncharacterised protein [Bordetella pertussis]